MADALLSDAPPEPRAPARPAPAWAAILVILLTLVAADQWVRRTVTPQGDILHRARAYVRQAGAPGPREVLIYGSCLPEQMMDVPTLQARAPEGVEIFQLGIASGTGLMWWVLLHDYLPEGADVAAILIPFGQADLSRRDVPWESHLMSLASWRDLPTLIQLDCDTVDCGLEIALRKASWLYRHRTLLAAGVWARLGVGHLEQGTRAAEYQRQWSALRPEIKDPWRYLGRFLDLAREKGVPVILTPLPTRSVLDGTWDPPPRERAELAHRDQLIAERGGHLMPFPEVPGLTAAHFEDDVHVGREGRRMVTAALAEALPRWLEEIDGRPDP